MASARELQPSTSHQRRSGEEDQFDDDVVKPDFNIDEFDELNIDSESNSDDEGLDQLMRQKAELESKLNAARAKSRARKEIQQAFPEHYASTTVSTGSDDSDESVVTVVKKMSKKKNPTPFDKKGTSTRKPKTEADAILHEIRNLPPPKLKLTKPSRISNAGIRAENLRRNRFPIGENPPLAVDKKGRAQKLTDVPTATVAPSVMVKPLPLEDLPSFDDVLKELGVPEMANPDGDGETVYFADCRILSRQILKDLVMKRAQILVARQESKMVSRGTQTFISTAGKQHTVGCGNCRSKEHQFRDCQLPFRPGFCHICGADGFDSEDCIYPHGIEHEYALQRCVGCGRDTDLYCPECPDCNIRYGDIVDWLRLNYATWPSSLVPKDHRYLINEGEEELRRKVKANFADPRDAPNRVRKLLIRENALAAATTLANKDLPTTTDLAEEKRALAIRTLTLPRVRKTLDVLMEERPELRGKDPVTVIVPTKYQRR